jgi:hypothetical protein
MTWRSQQDEQPGENQALRPAHPVKSGRWCKTAFFDGGSPTHPVYQRDNGQFEIGLTGLIGPFPSRRFAEAVARKEVTGAA